MSNLKISPPWYTLRNQIANSIGISPCISVSDLISKSSSEYIINIKVLSNCIAKSLRTILPSSYIFGPIKVSTIILNSNNTVITQRNPTSTAKEIGKNFCNALCNNPLFKGIIIPPEPTPFVGGKIFVVIDKTIIQFYNDDISDLCQNFNEVAAKVFATILTKKFSNLNGNSSISVSFSTYDEKCFSKQNIFCS